MQGAGNEGGEQLPWIQGKEDVSELMLGRSTFFCCLSCGVPFAFPDDAYLSEKEEAVKMLRFTHFVRKHMRGNDRSMASTTQWQLNRAHYIHSFLHTSMSKVMTMVLPQQQDEAEALKRQRAWAEQTLFVKHASELMKALFVQGGKKNPRKIPFKLNQVSPIFLLLFIDCHFHCH